MEHPLDVSLSEFDSTLLVQVRGDLDLATSSLLTDELGSAEWKGKRRVVIDLLGVGFMDSSGLGALIRLRNDHPDTEIALVANGDSPVSKVLQLTAMEDLFPIHPTTEAALA